jgi:hypothetical protein
VQDAVGVFADKNQGFIVGYWFTKNQLKLGDANEDSKSCGLKKRIRDSINLFNKHSYKMTNTISLKYYCAELVNPGP